jgi:hypothetical protein
MKYFLLISFFLLIKFSFPSNSLAAERINNIDELIIQVPDAAPNRNVDIIETALINLGGVNVVSFCNSQKCFCLNVDRNIQPTNDNIIRAVANLGYQLEVKTSGSIQEAQADCKDR